MLEKGSRVAITEPDECAECYVKFVDFETALVELLEGRMPETYDSASELEDPVRV